MSDVRIAHIATVDLSLRYLLLNQLASLKQAGYDVTGVSAPGAHVPTVEGAGVRHLPVALTRRFSPAADLRALWQLYRLFRRERFTIVHTHTPKPGLLGQLAARAAGVPIVINTLHGFYFTATTPAPARYFYIAMERIAAKCSDVILSQNAEDIETAVEERICRREKLHYLGNGIDISRFDRAKVSAEAIDKLRTELHLRPEDGVVGFVGRLVAEKGILELFATAAQVLQEMPNVRFLFVGPIDHLKADAIRPETARRYNIEHACVFTGLRDDMPELYALMDVFVLPSHREGFPRSLMEASAMGVPCVATDVRGCREAVEAGRNGFLTPLGDIEALSNAIRRVLRDGELRADLARGARMMAEQRFDEERVFETVRTTYARLLQAKGLGPDAR